MLPEDDALARQRLIVRWHPLRTINAMNVPVLGADLLTVRVRLCLDDDEGAAVRLPSGVPDHGRKDLRHTPRMVGRMSRIMDRSHEIVRISQTLVPSCPHGNSKEGD